MMEKERALCVERALEGLCVWVNIESFCFSITDLDKEKVRQERGASPSSSSTVARRLNRFLPPPPLSQ